MTWLSALLAAVLTVATACQGERAAGQVRPGGAGATAQAAGTGPAPTEQAPAGLAEWKMPVPDQGYNVREGRVLFHYYCSTCHGEQGHGDGLNAYNLDPKPRDLADMTFQQQRTDDDLAAVVRSGGGVSGLSTGMPPWGRTLTQRQIHNIVRFLRVLPGTPE